MRGGTLFLRRACGKLTAARLSDKSHFLFGSLIALSPLRTSQGESLGNRGTVESPRRTIIILMMRWLEKQHQPLGWRRGCSCLTREI